ncbi:unnamed protein product, partial [Rotaria sordida]
MFGPPPTTYPNMPSSQYLPPTTISNSNTQPIVNPTSTSPPSSINQPSGFIVAGDEFDGDGCCINDEFIGAGD